MSCKKKILFFEFESHCDHWENITVDNPHGKFQPNRSANEEREGFICCKCGRKRAAGYYELADA